MSSTMSSAWPVKEGYMPFKIPAVDKACSTYYKIIGNLDESATAPLILVHGGPGTGHEYLLPFTDLWTKHHIPVIFYDQVGCASSTHLREYRNDDRVWNLQTFLDELEALVDHLDLRERGYSLLGQSWGGMLCAALACSPSRSRGLRRLILASALADTDLAVEGYWLQIAELPAKEQHALEEAVRTNDYGASYKEAFSVWNSRHFCLDRPLPEALMPAMKNITDDRTSHFSMLGPSIFTPGGGLKDFSLIDQLREISVPTFVYNGEFDASHDVATVPFFEKIRQVKWRTYSKSSHMCHLEAASKDRVLADVSDFLLEGSNP